VPYEFESGLILLTIHSSLEGVGFLATVSAVRADAGIPCNAVSALHHDHLLVSRDLAQQVLELFMGVAVASMQTPG
jgi:hypothetical protein